jgi:hypothetical protein
MAQLIDLPDGTTGEFPDNMSSSDIEAVLQKQYPTPPSGPTTGDKALGAGKQLLNDTNATVQSLTNGALLGTAPYVTAGGNYAWNHIKNAISGQPQTDYADEVANAKHGLADVQSKAPAASSVSELVGSMAPAALTGGASLPEVMAKNAVTGAIQGAASADTPQDALKGAGIGGLAGAVGAGVVGGAAKVIGGGVKSMAREQLAKDIVSPDTVSRATSSVAPSDIKALYTGLGDAPAFAESMSSALKDTNVARRSANMEGAGPAFQAVTDFLKQAQPSVVSRALTGAGIGAAGGAGAVGYNAATTGTFDPTKAAELVGGGALLGASRGVAEYAKHAAGNAAIHSVLNPASEQAAGTAIGNVAGRGFSSIADYLHKTNIANTIQQDQQDGTPPEATDYKLQQTNADYRKMKQGN